MCFNFLILSKAETLERVFFLGLAGGVLGSEIFAEFLEIEIWAVGV
jgi:hypothetical protein